MKQLIGAILCLAAAPAWAVDESQKLVEPVQQVQAPKEEQKHSGFRRTKFTYVAPAENWGSVGRWFTGGITPGTFHGSLRGRRAAREERMSRQRERLAKGFANPFAPKVDTAPIARIVAPPAGADAEHVAPSSLSVAAKRTPREAQPGEFRPRIYGLD